MAIRFGVFVPQGWKRDLNDIQDPIDPFEAMTNVARRNRHATRAAAISGRSLRLPLSTSVNSATISPPAARTRRETASRCASRPRPEAPCLSVETR